MDLEYFLWTFARFFSSLKQYIGFSIKVPSYRAANDRIPTSIPTDFSEGSSGF
jgi:hypothetical protein